MRDNYAMQAQQARLLFARQDFDVLAHRHGLKQDDTGLLLEFCGRPYRVRRADAQVLRADGTPAAFHEVLSIYDLLNHTQTPPLAGEWCTVYALPHTLHSGTAAGPAASDGSTGLTPEQFCSACQTTGTPVKSRADYSFQIPVFGKVSVLLQYWQADEEFSAKLQCLWDRNAQSFVLFETMFYIMSHLYRQLGLN